jgi:trehalose-phosphatase
MVHAVLSQTSHPFVLAAGEKVFDIRPRVYWHKGSAVEWIAAKLGKPGTLPIYVGDDVTDEDAFAALTQGITVKVGEAGQTAARYQLDGPPEVRKFLEWIDELMRQMEFHRVEAQCKSPEEVVVG